MFPAPYFAPQYFASPYWSEHGPLPVYPGGVIVERVGLMSFVERVGPISTVERLGLTCTVERRV